MSVRRIGEISILQVPEAISYGRVPQDVPLNEYSVLEPNEYLMSGLKGGYS